MAVIDNDWLERLDQTIPMNFVTIDYMHSSNLLLTNVHWSLLFSPHSTSFRVHPSPFFFHFSLTTPSLTSKEFFHITYIPLTYAWTTANSLHLKWDPVQWRQDSRQHKYAQWYIPNTQKMASKREWIHCTPFLICNIVQTVRDQFLVRYQPPSHVHHLVTGNIGKNTQDLTPDMDRVCHCTISIPVDIQDNPSMIRLLHVCPDQVSAGSCMSSKLATSFVWAHLITMLWLSKHLQRKWAHAEQGLKACT